MLLLIGGGALVWRRRNGHFLTGQLIVISGPDPSLLPLPYDLGRQRRRHFYLGRQGRGEWRLSGWLGSASLRINAQGAVTLMPGPQSQGPADVANKLTLNEATLHQAIALQDGDIIGCGPYRIRYENLLL